MSKVSRDAAEIARYISSFLNDYAPSQLTNSENTLHGYETALTLYIAYFGAFIVDRNSNITMSFGLNRNANIFVGIYDTPSRTYLKTWDGFSGGLSIGVSPGRDTNVVGHIINRSSDPLTVTWARFVY